MKNQKPISQSQSFYDRFSVFYPLVDLFLMRQKKRMIREVNKLPHGSLLEAGVGNGSHLRHYQGHQITGIDTSNVMLKRAARRSAGVTLYQMNAEQLSFPDNSFDYVVLSHVIAVVEDPEKVLRESFRVLTPGGKMIILNHFTPTNGLHYVDRILQPVASHFHIRSEFYLKSLNGLQRFQWLEQITLGPISYFQLLILQKP